MSPEQMRGLNVDPRTDIWSCGVYLLQLTSVFEVMPAPGVIDQNVPHHLGDRGKEVRAQFGRDSLE